MPLLDTETWGKLAFGLYYLIGLPIAWRFMRQQDMTASSQKSGVHGGVVAMLAAMWPVLLFAMSVNWLQGTTGPSKPGLTQGKPRTQPSESGGSGKPRDQALSEPPPTKTEAPTAGIGILVFVFLCGLPALEMNGFGFGIRFTLSTAILCSVVGGLVGGALVCPRPLLAGVVGGALAGPLGLIAVYYYTSCRGSVWNLELVIVQGLASLPGVGVGLLVKRFSLSLNPPDAAVDERVEERPDRT